MKIMRASFWMLFLLFLLGSSAYEAQAGPRNAEGSQIQQGGGNALTPQDRPRFGPPPEAFKACEGKTAGSKAQFKGPDGEMITGTCRIADERLVLQPDRPPRGNSRDGHHGPPPEAYKACEDKKVGSIAQFVNPRGETIKGICEEEDGKLVLRPASNEGGRKGQTDSTHGEGRVGR